MLTMSVKSFRYPFTDPVSKRWTSSVVPGLSKTMGLLDFSVDTGSAAEDPTAPLNGWLMYLFCVPSQYFNVADQEPIAAVVELEVVDLQLRLALKSEMTTTDLSPPLQVGSGVADAQ